MSKTLCRRTNAALLLIILLAQQITPAQTRPQVAQSEADRIIQDLLVSRKNEHWDFWETQLLPTAPPRLRPVQAIPEWHTAGGVIMTLDSDYIESFRLNKLLHTEGSGDEILRQDPNAFASVRARVCRMLNAGGGLIAELLSHDPEVSASIESDCKGQARNAQRDEPADEDDTEDALLLAYAFLKYSKEDAFLGRLSFAHTFLRVVRDLAQHTKVLILVPGMGRAEDMLYDQVGLIKDFPGGRALLQSKNVQFIQIPVRTKWVRDYGPVFIRDSNNQVFCVDARYQTERESLAEKRQADILKKVFVQSAPKKKKSPAAEESSDEEEKADESEEQSRLFDDISPSLLATRLRQKNGETLLPYPVTVVRPPMALDGGDFFTDGEGVGFTSTETLQNNGGNVEMLNLLFNEYFGLRNVLYLQPLPGSTVKHIDMFLKVVSPKIILLGTFEGVGRDGRVSPIQTEAKRVLDYDLSILKYFYEGRKLKVNVVRGPADEIIDAQGTVNLVLVPMPDLSRPIREKLAKIDGDIDSLTKQLEQHEEMLQTAAVQGWVLNVDLGSLEDDAEKAKSAAASLQSPLEAGDVSLPQLKELFDEVVEVVEGLKEDYGTTVKQLAWQENIDLAGNLSALIGETKVSTGDELTDSSRASLARQLNAAADRLNVFVSSLRKFQSGNKGDSEQHRKEYDRIRDEYQSLLDQRDKLQKRYPYGSDIYRTFLNALQVRTGTENLLLMPTYNGLDEVGKRVREIFRRAYTSAYGSVTIIDVDSEHMIQLSGSIHCLTQTIPAELDVFPDDWNFRAGSAPIAGQR